MDLTMGVTDIVNQLNKVVKINGGKGHFVAVTQILPTVINAYKYVVITLWYIDGEYRKEVLAVSDNVKYTQNKKEKSLKSISLEFVCMILEWVNTDSFKERIGIDGTE